MFPLNVRRDQKARFESLPQQKVGLQGAISLAFPELEKRLVDANAEVWSMPRVGFTNQLSGEVVVGFSGYPHPPAARWFSEKWVYRPNRVSNHFRLPCLWEEGYHGIPLHFREI